MNETPSPYAPPKAEILELGDPLLEYERATLGRRFLNFLLDIGGYLLLALLVVIILGLYDESYLEDSAVDIWLGYPIYFMYYFLCESLTGRTLGKLITRTRVVDATGKKPGAGNIALRTLSRFIPFESFSFFRECREGWHDTLTKTHVVTRKKQLEQP